MWCGALSFLTTVAAMPLASALIAILTCQPHITLMEDQPMTILRFGRKLKLPSTRSIKHQLLMMMLQDEITLSFSSFNQPFDAACSPAIAKMRRLADERPKMDAH